MKDMNRRRRRDVRFGRNRSNAMQRGMTRRRFLGTAAAGVGAAAMGAGVVHADRGDSDHISFNDDKTEIYVRPLPAQPPSTKAPIDVKNVQWAVDNITPGGTVYLMGHDIEEKLNAFNFGTDGSVEITKNVNIVGEVLSRRIAALPYGSAEIGVEEGTTIIGGLDTIYCDSNVNLTVKDIRFQDGWDSAIRVIKSTGLTVTGCSIVGREQSVPGAVYNATAAYGIYCGAGYDDWKTSNQNDFSGNLIIENNYTSIGHNPNLDGAYDTGALQTYKISSVITVRNNEFRDGDVNMVAFNVFYGTGHLFENNVIDTGPTHYGVNAITWYGERPPWYPPVGGDQNAGMVVQGNTIIQRGKSDGDTVWTQQTKGSIIQNNTLHCGWLDEQNELQPIKHCAISGFHFYDTVVQNNTITGSTNGSTLAVFYGGSNNNFINNDINGADAFELNVEVYELIAPGWGLTEPAENNTFTFETSDAPDGNCDNLLCWVNTPCSKNNKVFCGYVEKNCGCTT
jgi:hypothetical protein